MPDKNEKTCYTKAQRDCDVIFLAVWSPANLVNSNEVRAVRRGGNVNNGANAGPCYFNANNAVSNANWNYGAALYPLPALGMAADAIPMPGR